MTRNFSVFEINAFLGLEDSNLFKNLDSFSKKKNSKLLVINSLDAILLKLDTYASDFKNKLIEMCLDDVKIIATVDNINASLIWNSEERSDLNWILHPMATFENYNIENAYRISAFEDDSKNKNLSALENVIKSLSEKSRKVFVMMVEKHFERENEKLKKEGRKERKTVITFEEMYFKCRMQGLVTQEQHLRSTLNELFDHEIIKTCTPYSKYNEFRLIYPNDILHEFIDKNK